MNRNGLTLALLLVASSVLAVDVTKTVKPAGGGDFTTLQAALDWVRSNVRKPTNAIVECYKGGDLGVAVVANSGWPNKPNSLTIRAAAGEAHDGKVPTTGCYIKVPSGQVGLYFTYSWQITSLVQRISFVTTNNAHSAFGVQGDYGAKNITFDGLLCYHTGTNKTTHAAYFTGYDSEINCIVRNSIIYGGATTNYAVGIFVEAGFAGITTLRLYNNTMNRCRRGTRWTMSSTPVQETIALTEVNDIAVSCRTGFVWGATSVVSSNNLSSDATSDDGGGSGHKINKPASDQFVNVTSDFNLKTTADAKDAGKSISSFSADAVGKSRPQGSAWDMGALEFPVSSAARRRKPVFFSIMSE